MTSSPSTVTVAAAQHQETIDKEAEQRRLEEEMKKRRERIEKWREEKKLKEQQMLKATNGINGDSAAMGSSHKSWNLEDDDDDEEDEAKGAENGVKTQAAVSQAKQQIQQQLQQIKQQQEEQQLIAEQMQREKELMLARQQKKLDEDEEEDPLDAFMNEISKEAKKVAKKSGGVVVSAKKKVVTVVTAKVEKVKEEPMEVKVEKMDTDVVVKDEKESETTQKKVRLVVGVAKQSKEKGHIMEQDIDGLEYESEEELVLDPTDPSNMPKLKTKAEMIVTDHTKIYYRAFRKDFYVEVPEISQMTPEGKSQKLPHKQTFLLFQQKQKWKPTARS